jgi:hypothetical protein
MPKQPKIRRRRACLTAVLVAMALCLLPATISALSNIGLPTHQTDDRLPQLDQARLSEALRLKAALGNEVWPGLSGFAAPVILWNRSYEFLIDFPGQPPAGWETTPDDSFEGRAYHRRPAHDPQNFAVPVGDLWAASIGTKAEADVFLIGVFRDMFPTPLKQIFPYRLLIQPSETQIGALLHELFHVYVRAAAPERLTAAESAHGLGGRYAAAAEAFRSDLRQEGGLLAQALEAQTDLEAADLTRAFLQARADRRQLHALDPDLVAYERWLEWEEGTAKHVELAFLRQAFLAPGYVPLEAMAADPDFRAYAGYEGRWAQELIQLRNLSGSDEQPFYMLGMAECFLLDRLLPGWKDRVLGEAVFLEDLLMQAVGP